MYVCTYICITHTLSVWQSRFKKFEEYNFFTDHSKLRKYISREDVSEK